MASNLKPSADPSLESVDGTVERLLYTGDSFAIFTCKEGFSVKGSLLDDPEALIGTEVTFLGKWGKPFINKKQQTIKSFQFSSYQIRENQTVFFLTKMVKAGITKQVALKIAKEIPDLGEVLENNPKRLEIYSGIGPKKIAKIAAKWKEFKHVKRLGELLLPYGITNNMILKIYNFYGENAESDVVEDTYGLTEIRGIGFKKADEIALRLGVAEDDPRRIKACLMYCMIERVGGEGNTATTLKDLLAFLIDEIGGEGGSTHARLKSLALDVLTHLLDENELAVVTGDFPQDSCYLATSWNLNYERTIKEACDLRSDGRRLVEDIDGWIARYERSVTDELRLEGRIGPEEEFRLGDQQRNAVVIANSLPAILLITGYAGTGKTATSRAILELYAEKFGRDSITGCALAGIAANRLQQQSGFESGTIHSTLGYKNGEWSYNRNNPLEAKVVLLDEGGMADSELTYRLMSAVNFKAGGHMIILGDDAQLDPVGAGQPFSDMIHLGLVACVKLDKIYRSDEEAVTTLFAADVRRGVVPSGLMGQHYKDFRFVERSIPDYWRKKKSLTETEMRGEREANNRDIREEILRLAIDKRDEMLDLYNGKKLREYLTFFQVLSPVHGNDLGVQTLNRALQAVLNPPSGFPELEVGGRCFRLRDKLVHLENQKMDVVPMGRYREWLEGRCDAEIEVRVMNGQLGVVVKVDPGQKDDPKVHVCYQCISQITLSASPVTSLRDPGTSTWFSRSRCPTSLC